MKYLIKNALVVNEGNKKIQDVLIEHDIISKIESNISIQGTCTEINGDGLMLMPGIIDDQVHFREPGLTHKANIATESKAAVAGGVTSYMEMPNTNPPALTQALLQDKYDIAANTSYANYSFFMGASNDNIEEIKKVDPIKICGVKIFMGSSTGNMLVDNLKTLEAIFQYAPTLIATHCEDENTVNNNFKLFESKYGEDIPMECHPLIRDVEACYLSSSMAKSLAEKFGSRLHILHITTAKELELFTNAIPLKDKKITSEVCVHHLWFDGLDYTRLGSKIKCNPAIKEPSNKKALFEALLDDRLDIIATDHAPHTLEEKNNKYKKAPSGLPLIQHSLQLMLSFYHEGKISLEKIIEKMCHAPAECFQLKDRGYIREGYKADLVLVNLSKPYLVNNQNILYKCGWSPFEGHTFPTSIEKVFVNGNLAFTDGKVSEHRKVERLLFNR